MDTRKFEIEFDVEKENWDKIIKSRCKSPYRNFISFKGIIAHIEKLKLANIIIIIKNYSHLPPEAGSILVYTYSWQSNSIAYFKF